MSWGDDGDLTDFVTRPDIKAPRFNVTTYQASRVTPGYWFTAPYAFIAQQSHPARYYQPCQTGPAIYDATGELVWSGACLTENQNTCDFRAWTFNDTLYTSAIQSWAMMARFTYRRKLSLSIRRCYPRPIARRRIILKQSKSRKKYLRSCKC